MKDVVIVFNDKILFVEVFLLSFELFEELLYKVSLGDVDEDELFTLSFLLTNNPFFSSIELSSSDSK
jgi:hypothetical protein